MTGIVKQLKAFKIPTATCTVSASNSTYVPQVCINAADEIERLQEALRLAKDRAAGECDFEGAARIRDALDNKKAVKK